jgi:RimJ/RimL family protein N-acetyltransferase
VGVPDPEFIERRTAIVELRDGTRVKIRPITPADREELAAAFRRLSPRSKYFRFLAPVHHLSEDMLTYLTEVDYHDHFAWGAALDEPGEPGIGVARYVRVPDEPEVAEAAVVVVDEYHGRGIGTLLLYALAESALQNGVERFRAYVLPENETMLNVLQGLGATTRDLDEHMIELEIPLPIDPEELLEGALKASLRAVARGEMQIHNPWERWMTWIRRDRLPGPG